MERTYEVAATPEQVWDAIATADGISAWMVPTRLDPQIGGAVSFDVGFWSHGIVTDYTPTRRFAYAEPWPIADHMPTADHDLSSLTPIATEFLIESASGGSCVIRVVTSAYGSGADWENEFFAEMIAGVIPILDNLATHLNEASVTTTRRTPPITNRACSPPDRAHAVLFEAVRSPARSRPSAPPSWQPSRALPMSVSRSTPTAIPIPAFAWWTIVGAALGVVLARLLRERRRFVVVTTVAVGLSLIPAIAAPDDTATKAVLVGTHLLAAAIIIPTLSQRLAPS